MEPANRVFEPCESAVDVWEAALDLAPEDLQPLARLLSPSERERASRFRFERDRRRFIAARGRLRQLLGRYAGAPPEAVPIEVGASGKPFIGEPAGLEFNLAHSDDRVVIAVADRPVGVDVERIRPLPDLLSIAARFFASGEYEPMRHLTGAALEATFFRCWTLKEAYLKASGEGLRLPLSTFQVSLDDADPRLIACDCDPDEPSRWTFAAWTDGAFATALAVAATTPSMRVRRRSWPPA